MPVILIIKRLINHECLYSELGTLSEKFSTLESADYSRSTAQKSFIASVDPDILFGKGYARINCHRPAVELRTNLPWGGKVSDRMAGSKKSVSVTP